MFKNTCIVKIIILYYIRNAVANKIRKKFVGQVSNQK